MAGHTNAVMGLAFSPDEKRLVSISSDQTARLWDGETGQLIAVLRGHTGRLTGIAFNPHGTRVVTSSYDRTMRLWDAQSGELITVLRGHHDATMLPAYSSDGCRLVSFSTDGTVRVWDMDLIERNVGLRGTRASSTTWRFAPTVQSCLGGVGRDGAALESGDGPTDRDISQRFRDCFVRGV